MGSLALFWTTIDAFNAVFTPGDQLEFATGHLEVRILAAPAFIWQAEHGRRYGINPGDAVVPTWSIHHTVGERVDPTIMLLDCVMSARPLVTGRGLPCGHGIVGDCADCDYERPGL